MSWENRFSTMVKESSIKIDEAKRRLHDIDTTRNPVRSYTASSYSPSYSTLRTASDSDLIAQRDSYHFTSDSSSLTLLHTLCEKTERQSQICDLLKTKIETLEVIVKKQDKEIGNLNEQLSQVCDKIDQCEPLKTHQTLDEWKSEMKNEISKINAKLQQNENDDGVLDVNSTVLKRNESALLDKKEWAENDFDEIRNRLDMIEMGLSSYHRDVETNSKMVDKNILLLTDLKDSNKHYLERLNKLQNLTGDEVNHVRTDLSGVQHKVHELEGAIHLLRFDTDFSSKTKLGANVDDFSEISQKKKPTEFDHISISSDEQLDLNSSTTSSVNLEGSDNNDDLSRLTLDDLNIEDVFKDQDRSGSSVSEPPESLLNYLSGSEISLNDI